MALWDLFQNHTGRIIHKWTHYFPVYEKWFAQYIGKPLVFLEIGCGKGGSLQMWKQYFGPHAIIVGVDIDDSCKEFEEDQINIRIGNQADKTFLESIIAEFGKPDIILDDGSHKMSDILTSFKTLYSKTNKTGIYMIEDLHTAYWDEYEGGLERNGTFIEKSKSLIDELNADHSRGAIPSTDFTKSTIGMHFYDSIVVFERGTCGRKHAPQIGTE